LKENYEVQIGDQKSGGHFKGQNQVPHSSFGGLGVSTLASGTQVRGFKPAEAVGLLREIKSSVRLPSEGV
jgi:hypothetical protein